MDFDPSQAIVFLVHPKNASFVEGRSAKPKGLIPKYWLVILLALALGGFGIWLLYDTYQKREAYFERERQEGYIEGQQVARDSSAGRNRTYYVTYRYEIDGRTYQKREATGYQLYNQFQLNAPITIRYAPNNPSNAIIASRHSDPIMMAWFGLALFGGGVLMLAVMEYQHVQKGKLFREGVMLPAELVKQHVPSLSKRGTISLTYRFTSPQTGQVIQRKVSFQDNKLKRRMKNANAGTPLMILYRNDKHHEPL